MGDSGSLPVGSIVAMLALASHPPVGWLLCDGQTFSGEDYPQLAQILPNNVLPDLRGYTLIGAGKAQDGEYSAQATYGARNHTMTLAEMPSHQHFGFGEHPDGFPLGDTSSNSNMGSKGDIDYDNKFYGTTFTGGIDNPADRQGNNKNSLTYNNPQPNAAFSLMQPSFAVNFFICAE
jgi:microcystin-dependent protein